MSDLQSWLDAQGLGKYAAAFAAQDITLDLLPDLLDADLRELGVASLGDRKRFLKAASAALAPTTLAPARPAAAAKVPPPARAPEAVIAASALPAGLGEEGERRHATVMFSDLTGYTALNEAFDPEEVEQIMARIKHEASAVIERHGGRVNQFVGDEVMALFGIPIARRDDPRRAVAAALQLHQAVDQIAASLSVRLGRMLAMHTGLQSGLVIARRSDSRSGDYTITGDTVNTAARLRGLAQPGEVVVSPQTWQQVSDFFDGEAGAAVEVKGKEHALVPYRILGVRAVPRAGSRPLVGRTEEMQQFETLVEACLQRGRGRVVFVRGDPGMGKSRLVAEFLHVGRERGLNSHNATILDFGARTGHDAMRVLAQSLLGLASDADAASRAEAINQFAPLDAHGTDQRPLLYDLLDVPPPADVRSLLSALDSAAQQKSALDALCDLVRAEAKAAPMLLLLEDIHWADSWTLQQIGALVALAATQPLLVLLTTRFAGDPSIGAWRTSLHGLPVSSIDLSPLNRDDALRMAAGAASISESLLRSCVERSEGNPLFLEQLLLNAGDEGATSLPGSIQALIQARMDRLSQADKNALQAAAVWGHRIPLAVIRHLLADPDYDSRVLQEQFLLLPDGDALIFSHALIRDGAYGSLLHARRRQLHQLAAQWIEPQDLALAAEHFERAEDPRAAAAYLRASDGVAEKFLYPQALGLIERGLKLAGDEQARFGLTLARSRLLLKSGHSGAAIEASGAAIEAARSDSERGLSLTAMASALRIVGRSEEGLAMLDQAQPLLHQAGLTRELSDLHELRGNLLFGMGRSQECLTEHQLALKYARECGSLEAEVAALGGMGDGQYAQGRVRTAYDTLTQCVGLAREHGFLSVEAAYLPMIGWTSLYMMDVEGAIAAARSAIDLGHRIMNPRVEMMGHSQLVMFDGWVRGNWRDSGTHLDQGMELARQLGSRRFEAIMWFFRALVALRAGDRALTRTHLMSALEVTGFDLVFIGPQVFAILALVEDDPGARALALEKGEALLSDSVLSHNFFIFYEAGLKNSLVTGDLEQASAFCDKLDAFMVAEPFPWGEFVVARGRALVRWARGERAPELVARITALRQQAFTAQCDLYLPELDAALAQV